MTKQELHKVAPILSKISKESGFKVPHDYFDAVEQGIVAELISKDMITPREKEVFKTPTNYFDTVEDLVVTRLKSESLQTEHIEEIPENYFETIEDQVIAKLKKETKVISLKSVMKYVAPIAVAASLLFIFILSSPKKDITSFDALATSEIEALIESGLVDIDAESLANAFSDIDLSTDLMKSSITDSDMLNYLTDEDLDQIIYDN